jgi:replicative DNA helicase
MGEGRSPPEFDEETNVSENVEGRPIRVPRSVTEVFGDLDRALRAGNATQLVPIPTGFQPLDRVLGGGLHPGELILAGGAPGVGKTILTLQWARNIAAGGATAIYVCYEHEEAHLLLRLLAMEMGELPGSTDPEMERLRDEIIAAAGSGTGLGEVLEAEALARRAYERVEGYADRLWLLRASGTYTGLPEIEQILVDRIKGPTVLFVDYLQKVAVYPETPDESEKVTRISEGLKDLALNYRVPVVCVVASDRAGLKTPRLRLQDFRGSSALAYESDVAIVLNEKLGAVSKVHLAFDPLRAKAFQNLVILSVEKNRGGPNLVDLEHRKDFLHFRFDPMGGMVAEKLVDERAYIE